MSQAGTGAKVRKFRINHEMSQLELETELNAASGYISRVEVGKIEPSKEMLLRIAKVFNLKPVEITSLLGIATENPSPQEIEAAISEVEEYFQKSNVYAYLLDEKAVAYNVSKGFLKLLGKESSFVNEIRGRHIDEIILDSKYGVRKYLDESTILSQLAVEVARTQLEIDLEQTSLFEGLMQVPDFPTVWEMSKEMTTSDIFSQINRVGFIKVMGMNLQMRFAREKLKSNPRFEVVEYIPENKYLRSLNSVLSKI